MVEIASNGSIPVPHRPHPWPSDDTNINAFTLVLSLIGAIYLLGSASLYFYSLRQWFKMYYAGFQPVPTEPVFIRPEHEMDSEADGNEPESTLLDGDMDDGDDGDKENNVRPFRREVGASMQVFRWFTAFLALLATLATTARLTIKLLEDEPYQLPLWHMIQKFFYFIDIFAPDGIWMLTTFIAFILSVSQAFIKRYDAPTLSYSLSLFNFMQFITSAIAAFVIYNAHDEVPVPRHPYDHIAVIYWLEVGLAVGSITLTILYGALGSIDSSHKVEFAKGHRIKFANLETFESQCSVMSYWTFQWLNPLIKLGSERPLTDEDVWQLRDWDRTPSVLERFEDARDGKKGRSLLFLNRILVWVQSEERDITLGLAYLIGLFLSNAVKALLDGQEYFHGRRVGLNVRSIIISEVYAKSLRRAAGVGSPTKSDGADGGASTSDTSVGKIVTLMSVDSERIREYCSYSHRLFVQYPIALAMSVTGLMYVLGPSALAGLTIILVSGPVTAKLGGWMNKVQEQLMASTDKRVNAVNEVLNGIRIIK
ncbi:hypothetical protein HDV05_000235, partial [Chytridiales sp. JEL 0842]